MKVVEPRSLLTDEVRIINAGVEIVKQFNQVKSLMKEKGIEPSELDLFFAGYILANPNVRDSFKKVQDKEIKRDNRISMELWRGSKKE